MMIIILISGGENTHFIKDGQDHNYNFANNEPFEFTMKIRKNGNLHLRALKGNPAATLSCESFVSTNG